MSDAIAIVAAAGRFPGSGADLAAFWANVSGAVDCSREVPEGRWRVSPHSCLVHGGPTPDAVYSTRGYFLDPFEPDLTDLKIDPTFVAQLDPLFHLVLDVGGRAWRESKNWAVDPRRVGVVLGNICLPTDKSNDLCREVLGGKLSDALGRTRERRLTHPLNRYSAGLPAALLAKSLGLGLGSFTLDAACASSLYAIKLAVDELISGRADAMLAGGCSRPDALYTQMGFSQLRALSPSGRCSPFDAAADGLVVGEGAGIFVLKRLDDALTAEDEILAVMHGAGLSNDTSGNLLAPAVEGQIRAMQTAYAAAKWNPTDVDLIECHATGTPVGDAIEFESIRTLWGESGWKEGQCVIGSVKSTVGHLLTGAGAAALMKVIYALREKVLPPQANFKVPGPSLAYHGGPLRVLQKAEPWPTVPNRPHRAAVSGFGFGGVNGHLLFEEWSDSALVTHTSQTIRSVSKSKLAKMRTEEDTDSAPIAVVGMSAQFGPWSTLREFQERVLGNGIEYPATPKRTGWELSEGPYVPGYYIEELNVPIDRFRIPPKEIEEMLPQQAAVLMSAAAALEDVKRRETAGDSGTAALPQARKADPRAGVFLGVSLDPNTTNYHLRWCTKDRSTELADSAGPPLTADRTIGALASCAASRIAKVFQFGGPSFTVCSEGTSSGRALELAVRSLRMGEVDRAVVGGVDFVGDPRSIAASHALHRYTTTGLTEPLSPTSMGALPGEGSAAVVLKRLADAERDGDRVYAVIRGIGSSVGGSASGSAPDSAAYASSFLRALSDASIPAAGFDYLELASSGNPETDAPESDALLALLATAKRSFPLCVGAVSSQIGHTGAASFLAGFVKTCLAIYHEILPPAPIPAKLARPEYADSSRILFTTSPQFWLTEKPNVRRAAVAGMSVDGTVVHAVLEEHEKNRPQPVEVRSRPNVERRQPLGARPEAVFALEYEQFDEWERKASELDELATTSSCIERIARVWLAKYRPDSKKRRAVALVARNADDLRKLIQSARANLSANADATIPDLLRFEPQAFDRDRIFHSPKPLGRLGKLAFVYPGSGNQYAGMGRTISAQWPELLRRQQAENEMLRGQYAPDRFWSNEIPADTTAKQFLFGQVAFGTLTSDLLQVVGVKPDAMIGLSLGESAGLFGTRVWRTRDEMLRRVRESTLFGPDLGPPYHAAQQHFNYTSHGPVDWVVGIVSADPDDIRSKMRPKLRAFLLIVNTPNECVIGGFRDDVAELVTALGGHFIPLSGVTLAHCEAGKPVERSYRELHRLPTVPVSGLKVYSGAWARSYIATDANAADSITAGFIHTIDFPAVIEAAYRDGVRLFVEAGPGASCTRMIDTILSNRPHLARAMTAPRQDELSLVLRVIANLIAERANVDLGGLYGRETAVPAHLDLAPSNRPTISLPVGLIGDPIPVVLPSAEGDSSIFRSVRPSEISAFEPFGKSPEAWHPFDKSAESAVKASVDLPMPDDDDSIIKMTPRSRAAKSAPVSAVETGESTTSESIIGESSSIQSSAPLTEIASGELAGQSTVVETERIVPVTKESLAMESVFHDPYGDDVADMDDMASAVQPIPADVPPAAPAAAPTAYPTVNPVLPSMPQYNPVWIEPVIAASVGAQTATASAHELFLRIQSDATSTTAAAVGVHSELVRRLLGDVNDLDDSSVVPPIRKYSVPPEFHDRNTPSNTGRLQSNTVPRSLNMEQCFEFARGKIGNVLGPTFAEIDQHPTRVRLPDNELMLVDSITTIEGEPKSMTKGRVVTEHTVHAQRWYLDSGVCPTSVTVESGQADLFLSGFLGIDFQTKGLAVYRLLDAVVTFHRGLPKVGEKIVYDIHIDEFFRQADSWLFRFHFEGTINGKPMLSMQNGVAGFFTQAALDSGKGIIHTKLDLVAMPGKKPADWVDYVPPSRCSLDAAGVLALRGGRLAEAFGPAFANLNLSRPMKLPGGKLRLVDRVPEIDPHGGRFGIGFVRAEYDIHPSDWFIVCHFVDDRVMPGTLMYECCLHTLRILLMRLGWVGEDGVVCEPVPGINSRLKCRGQVLDTTKLVTYEVSIKELGYGPEPYCIADALMYADGKPIVEISNMSLRMTGLSKAKLDAIWAKPGGQNDKPLSSDSQSVSKQAPSRAPGSPKQTRYDSASIMEYSNGKPSEAFGKPYEIFDRERIIARLPGPPYQFLDRVTDVVGAPFELKAGAACETEYTVPPDAWYFESNRCGKMPFSILLEIALQPCGWLAAYCGSALTSESDLSFRNLGGKGTQFQSVTPESGLLTVNVKMTNVSISAGMIIQHFDLLVTNSKGKVYEGNTYFGFFGKSALANQIGMPQAKVPYPTPSETSRSIQTTLPTDPPFPAPMLRMVDKIEAFIPDGGKAKLGKIVGTIKVDPSFWFFQAHFYQDPVWPGSLGLESFLQLLKFVAWKRYGSVPADGWQTVAVNQKHEWTYRGQVVPKDREVTVVLEVTAADDTAKRLTADGFLIVDGRIIYQMKDFTLD